MKINIQKEQNVDGEMDSRMEDVVKYFEEIGKSKVDYQHLLKYIENKIGDVQTMGMVYGLAHLRLPEYVFKYHSLDIDMGSCEEKERLNEKKFSALENDLIYLSKPTAFNDPFDSKGYFADITKLNKLEKSAFNLFEKDDIFDTSFTANDYNCMPMWAHYSNNHSGYCVKYSLKENSEISTFLFPVQYSEEKIDVTDILKRYSNYALEKVSVDKDDIFLLEFIESLVHCVKHISWEYEKEFRFSISGDGYKEHPYISAIPSEIYVGYNCSKVNEKKLIGIAEKKGIPISKMHYSNQTSDFNLIKIEKKSEAVI